MNKLREALEGETLWGLPEYISDELVDSYRLTPIRWIGSWLYMTLMISGFGLGAWIWVICENKIEHNAKISAVEINAFAYDVNFGFGLLIGLFVWIILSAAFVSIITRILPMPIKGALFLGSQSDVYQRPPISTILDDRINPINATEFLNHALNKTIFKFVKTLPPFIIVVIGITLAELNWFSMISANGFHKSHPFSEDISLQNWRSGLFSKNITLKNWRDVERVELGCNKTDDGGSVVYKVIWPDGTKKRLSTDTHINGQNWLINLEVIDTEISKGNAEFVRWKWLKRDSLHPKCLRNFYAEQGPDGKARIDRLLRIGEFE